MLNIFFVFFRQPDNSNIRINSSNASAAKAGSNPHEISLDFQRNYPHKRILLNPHVPIHMHGDFLFYQFILKLSFYFIYHILKSCCI